jgi:hypothetical protein
VPVLSEQMVVALPMVSHAARCRIRFLSRSICLTTPEAQAADGNAHQPGAISMNASCAETASIYSEDEGPGVYVGCLV